MTVEMISLNARLIVMFVSTLGFSLAASAGSDPTHADAAARPVITIDVSPRSLLIRPDESGEVTVTVSNDSDSSLRDVRMSRMPNQAVTLSPQPDGPREIPAQGAARWSLAVKWQQRTALATVPIGIEYTWDNSVAGYTVPTLGFATASFDVREPSLNESLTRELAEVTVKTTVGSLRRDKPGILVLVVRNKTDLDLTAEVTKAESSYGAIEYDETDPDKPAHATRVITVGRIGSSRSIKLEPGATGEIQYALTTNKRVNPGRYLVTFAIKLDTRNQTQSMVAHHELDVGVFGNELVAPLQITTLALAPGVIFLLILAFVANFTRQDWAKRLPEMLKPEFWAVAIMVSVAISLVIYPFLFGAQITGIYSTDDVVGLLAFGALSGVVVALTPKVFGWLPRPH